MCGYFLLIVYKLSYDAAVPYQSVYVLSALLVSDAGILSLATQVFLQTVYFCIGILHIHGDV